MADVDALDVADDAAEEAVDDVAADELDAAEDAVDITLDAVSTEDGAVSDELTRSEDVPLLWRIVDADDA